MTTMLETTAGFNLQEPAGNSHDTSDKDAPSGTILDDYSSQSSSISDPSRTATLDLSTSDLSRSTVPTTGLPHDRSPPSSTASPSEQHIHRSIPRLHALKQDAGYVVGLEQDFVKVRADNTARGHSPPAPLTLGSKRTVNGLVKPSEYARPVQSTSVDNGDNTHAVASGSVSNSNQPVTEISQQLRTKLEYAMFKVQNGWQTRSLDEVESLTSASPQSVASGFRHVHDRHSASPRATLNPRLSRSWSDSSSSESVKSESHLTGSAPSRTGVYPTRPNDATSRGLAPPANIVAGSRRRPVLNVPPLSLSTTSRLAQSSPYSTRPTKTKRTPSQSAAMEADAVETLLFMASPNNSAYNPSRTSQESSLRSTQQFSPLRAQFSQTSVTSPRKVAFTEQHADPPSFGKVALIERELDDMADDSADDLDELEVKPS